MARDTASPISTAPHGREPETGASRALAFCRFVRGGSPLECGIVAAFVLLVALVWVGTVQWVRAEETASERQVVRENTNLAIAYEEHTLSTLRTVEQTTELLAHLYVNRTRPLTTEDIEAGGATTRGMYTSVGIVNADGEIIVGTRGTRPTNVSDRDYYLHHRASSDSALRIGTPTMGRRSGVWTIHMTRRINHRDGSFAGVAIVSVDPAYFTNFYRKVNLGPSSLVVLAGTDGVTRARRMGDTVTQGQDISRSALIASARAAAHGDIVSTSVVDGEQRYVSYRRLVDYPLVVAVGTARADLVASLRERERRDYLGAGFASLLLLSAAGGLKIAVRRQRFANQALARSEAHFRATFDQAAVGVAHFSLDGIVLRANPAYCAIVGYPEHELVGQLVTETTHPADRPDPVEMRARLLAYRPGKHPPVLEVRKVRKDGTVIWVSIAIAVLRDAAGRPDHLVAMVQDISARKAAEERYRATFNQAAAGIALVGLDGRFVQTNAKLCGILGYSAGELDGRDLADVLPPDQLAISAEHRYRMMTSEGPSSSQEYHYTRKDGSRGWALRSAAPVRGASGKTEYFITVVLDITERKLAEAKLKESEEQFRELAHHIPQAFWIADAKRDELIYLSPAFERISGIECVTLHDAWRAWRGIIHPDDKRRVVDAHCRMTEQALDQRFRIVRDDGTMRWVHERGFPVRDDTGEVYRIAGTIEDVTDRQLLEQRLQHQAHYDALTGLPNRVLTYDRLRQALYQAQRKDGTVGVLFLDLDRFKIVNDTLGHILGDRLLEQLSQRVSGSLRAGDTVGRMGGDEFAIVLSELAHGQDASVAAQTIFEALAQPFQLGGHEVFVTASIGIALYPADGTDADTLLKNADAAMFSAKSLGKNNFQFYTAEMNDRALEKLLLETNLRRALERKEFVLHLQPKASLTTGRMTGCEALIRWQPPDGETRLPGQFISVLEESGLIVPVGEWVLREACAQARAWQDAGLQPVPIAVNLSAKQFQHQNLCAVVESALRDYGVAGSLLELEVTEGAAMHNAEEAIVTLGNLKALGVRIAIDDFGTGYSSLSYLKRFPVDILKLDRSFVRDLPNDADDAAIARAVITLAHSLNLEVVAEGVESEEQLAFLAAKQCDAIQGYHLSRPLTVPQFRDLLASEPRWPRLLGASKSVPQSRVSTVWIKRSVTTH